MKICEICREMKEPNLEIMGSNICHDCEKQIVGGLKKRKYQQAVEAISVSVGAKLAL